MIKPIKRGDIFLADLTPVKGSEQGGKTRPVIIVQNNLGNLHSPTVIVAAVTSKGAHKPPLPTHVDLAGARNLREDSVALLEHIRTIDRSRLEKRIGSLDNCTMDAIDKALAVSLGIRAAEVS